MKPAPIPANEEQRLAALHRYDAVSSEFGQVFHELTELAATICEAPIALITLIDAERQWLKSTIGIEGSETSRDVAFCAHAILQREVFHVADATRDDRFADNPYVTGDPNIRFYAGAPLITPDGMAIGTMCAIDRIPRQLTPHQSHALEVLAKQVIAQLELRHTLRQLRSANATKDKLFSVIAHDLRGAVGGMRGISEIIATPDPAITLDECREFAGEIHSTAAATAALLEDLLAWSRLESGHLEYKPAPHSAQAMIREVVDLVAQTARRKNVSLTWSAGDDLRVLADRNMLRSTLQNLASNAIKFTPSGGTVRISATGNGGATLFSVDDTGVGMNADQIARLFQSEPPGSTRGTAGESGTGLGLMLCKQFVERHGGRMQVTSHPQQGSKFSFSLPGA